jgi:type IV pilus assembly protein PilE
MTNRPSLRAARPKGFTLIELMVTVTIVAILAAIALPGFNSQIRKSRRTEARTELLDLATRAERLYSTTNSYLGTTTPNALVPADLGYTGNWPITNIGSGYYSISLSNSTATSFTFTATAVGLQALDTQCHTFTVDNTGNRTASDSSAPPVDATQTCWN